MAVYIHFIWYFVIVVTILVLCLCYLYIKMRKAQEREARSSIFSNLIIEGMETERQRIARELHDMIIPRITDPELSYMLRTICTDLMPPDFSKLSFKTALRELCTQFMRQSGINCVCFIEEEIDFSKISAENQLHLYRIVREAFNNIEKHSGASKAMLTIQKSGTGNILICVSDNGKGIRDLPGFSHDKGYAEGNSAAEGIGMISMKQRAYLAGADLKFISETGNGLIVRIEV